MLLFASLPIGLAKVASSTQRLQVVQLRSATLTPRHNMIDLKLNAWSFPAE
jgi:hypothetical protein